MISNHDRLTRALAERIVRTRYEEFSDATIRGAKVIILDALGVMLAASGEPIGRILTDFIEAEAAPQQCTVVGLAVKTSPFWAAFSNGTLCRALEYDPISPGHHPCGANLPPCLALTERRGLTGRRFLEAFIIGVELQHRLYQAAAVRALHSSSMGSGRGVLGTLPAAAAAAKLADLSWDLTQQALAIAASRTGGIDSTGTMCNPGDSGSAASSGVMAATLAAKGFTGRTNLFEGPYGFKQFLGDAAPVESIVDNFGKPWGLETPGIELKAYSCQGHTHRTIEAILTLFREQPWDPQDIASIDIVSETLPTVAPYNYYTVKNDNPASSIDARFSVRYIAGVTALDGALDVDSFADAKRLSAPVMKMLEKVRVQISPEKGYKVSVTLQFRNGTSRYMEVSRAMSLAIKDAPEKFLRCAQRAITEEAAYAVMEMVQTLENQILLGPLFELIQGNHPTNPN
jgi:2-methylcitrate dehydratase PrpD